MQQCYNMTYFLSPLHVSKSIITDKIKKKGKFHSRTGCEDTEGKRYSSTLSLTLVLDGGGW